MGEKKVRRNPFVGTKFSSAKAEIEARLNAIEPKLASAILSGSVHTVDCSIYSAKPLFADTTIDLMESADAKKVGVTNINKRQLEANTYALITGIQMLQASVAEASASDSSAIASATYGVVSAKIANGELEIKNGDKILYPRNSCEVFRTTSSSDRLQGYHALECPKIIVPLTDIVPTLYVGGSTQETTNDGTNVQVVKIVLHGVRTNKA